MRKFTTRIITYLFPRLQDAVFVGILVAVTAQGALLLNGDGDLGRHITIGTYVLNHGKIPTRDIFSHTMTGEPLVPHEWLAQVAFAGVHAWFGLVGVILLVGVLIALTFTFVYREMLRRDVFRILALLITTNAAYASTLHWLARPHIFTFLFTAVWTSELENPKSKVWLFPLLMLLWANTHGAFIAGFIILGAHLAGWGWEYLQKQTSMEAGKRLLIIALSSFAVTLLNPSGWHLWETSVGYLGNNLLVDQTIEYQSPNFHNWSTWPFLILLAAGIVAGNLGRRFRPHEAILFAGWAIMSLYSARNIPLFAIVMASSIAVSVQGMVERISSLAKVDINISRVESNLKGIVWPLLATVLLTITFVTSPSAENQFHPNRFPVKAVDWLSTHRMQGKMFNNFIWGGYLLYRLWPQQTVFIDGQTDFYGEPLTREYLQVATMQDGWETVLKKYDVSWVIVQADKPLVQALQENMDWTVVYSDGTAAILRKPQATGSDK